MKGVRRAIAPSDAGARRNAASAAHHDRRPADIGYASEGDISLSPLLSIPDVLRRFNVDPVALLERVGMDAKTFDHADNRASFGSLGALLQEAAAATGCDHLGLLVAAEFRLSSLGAIGYLMQNDRSVRSALKDLVLHLHLHDRGGVSDLVEVDDRSVALTYAIYHPDTVASDVVYDGAIGICAQILRELCGPDWKPLAIELSRAKPRDVRPYREFFGITPRWDAPLSRVVFSRTWLERPVPGADPSLYQLLSRLIDELEAKKNTRLTENVRRALRSMVMTGRGSAANVARVFSVGERVLRRRLEAEGTNIRELMNETRVEVAKQLLAQTELPLGEIAAVLNYSEASSFSRAFHLGAGMSPREWRMLAGRR